MYDFSNFGLRLQELRKKKGMTQEDLAHRIGVSAQAVSKWENNQSYPDITSIPDLAQILGTSISHLFGEQSSTPALTVQFPDSYEGLPLVSTFKQVACYSGKAVESKDESGVKFADGSTAELSTRMTVNKGQGEILFLENEESMYEHELQVQGIDTSVTSKKFEFGHTQSVNITVLCCACKIVPSQDDKTRVYAKGSPKFLHTLYVEYDQSEMFLRIKPIPDGNNSNFPQFKEKERDNHLTIELPVANFENNIGGHMQLCINGSSNITSEIPLFNTGHFTINGSGSITTKEFVTSCKTQINGSGNVGVDCTNEFGAQISGSGNVSCGKAEKAHVNINGSGNAALGSVGRLTAAVNGSGDIAVGSITDENGDFIAKIAGSGDISIGGGSCQKFDVDLMGSGDIEAGNLTATKAHIVIHESGSVTLGRVIESSTEQVKKKGKIKILSRGGNQY